MKAIKAEMSKYVRNSVTDSIRNSVSNEVVIWNYFIDIINNLPAMIASKVRTELMFEIIESKEY